MLLEHASNATLSKSCPWEVGVTLGSVSLLQPSIMIIPGRWEIRGKETW